MSTPDEMKTALAEAAKPESLKDLIEFNAKELGRALPEHMRPERVVRIALTCVRLNPELATCTPLSFIGALFTSAQLGIEPIAGRAWLLPFKNSRKKPDGSWHTVKECQFVLGYKGVVDLFYRHEKTINLAWGIRRAKDMWTMELGTNARLTHVPVEGDRGPVVGYWAMAHLINGGMPFHYMTREECLEHGKKHSKTFDKKSGSFYESSPWVKDEEAMCLKTVLTQGAKLWPISVELQRALDADETARDFRPGVDNMLDIPSTADWNATEQEAKGKTDAELQKENQPQ